MRLAAASMSSKEEAVSAFQALGGYENTIPLSAIMVLKASGADISALRTINGLTPLHIVAYHAERGAKESDLTETSKSLIEWCVNARISPDVEDKTGQTPMHSAARSGIGGAVNLLKGDVNHTDKAGNTPLHIAVVSAMRGGVYKLGALMFLLAKEARFEEKNNAGETPLAYIENVEAGVSAKDQGLCQENFLKLVDRAQQQKLKLLGDIDRDVCGSGAAASSLSAVGGSLLEKCQVQQREIDALKARITGTVRSTRVGGDAADMGRVVMMPSTVRRGVM